MRCTGLTKEYMEIDLGNQEIQKVFPELTCIISLMNRIKVIDECISDPVIPKVVPVCFGDFLSQIARKSLDLYDNEYPLEQIQVAFHGLFGDTKLIA